MTTPFKPIITLQLALQSNKLHIYVCIYTLLIVIRIIKLKKWQKPGQEEWTISKSFVSQPPQIWGCSGVLWATWSRSMAKWKEGHTQGESRASCQSPENHSNTLHKCGKGTRKAWCRTSPQLSTLHSSPARRPETKPWWFEEQLHRTALTKGKRREEYTLRKKAVKCRVSS